MRFDIMTLFPALVETVLSESIIGRAQKNGILQVHAHNIRDYSENKHRRVDDTPYGGGRGMLMAAPPVWNCWQAVLADERFTEWLDESAALNNLYIETPYPTDLPLELDESTVRSYFRMAEDMFAAIRKELYDGGRPHRIKK